MQLKLLGIQGATSLEMVTAATTKLSGAELVAALASANLTKEEQESIRKGLLVYCELDTYAMVKIWEKLKEVISKDNSSKKLHL